jgi:hypothetical protein
LVQVYYRSNFHWYLKQQWSGFKVRCFGFDSEYEGRIILSEVFSNSSVEVLRIVDMTQEIFSSESSLGTTGVVDGCNVRLSPLGISMVPPPIFSYSLSLPGVGRYVHMWSSSLSTSYRDGVATLLHNNVIELAVLNERGAPLAQKESMNMNELFSIGTNYLSTWSLHVTEIMLADKHEALQIVVVGSSLSLDNFSQAVHDQLFFMVMPFDSHSDQVVLHIDRIQLYRKTFNGSAIGRVVMCPKSSSGRLFLAVSTASSLDLTRSNGMDIVLIDADTSSTSFGQVISKYSLPEVMVSFHMLQIPQTSLFGVIGLSSRHRLYCGEALLLNAVSSYALNLEYNLLLPTTLGSKPLLHFIALEKLTRFMLGNNNNNSPLAPGELQLDDIDDLDIESIQCFPPRPVERGARIIASIAKSYKVILQMPRGNLESFEPRVLILLHVKKLLSEHQDYYNCLVLLRRQRVDLNLLVDFNPELFSSSIDAFISAIIATSAYDLINLLVSSLEDEDVVLSKYPILLVQSTQPNTEKNPIYGKDSKVNYACRIIREALMKRIEDPSIAHQLLHPILSTYAKSQPPMLAEALSTLLSLSKSTASTG